MKLKDIHPDMSRYLEEDCYCLNEIYDISGFFYMLFPEDSPCELIAKGDNVFACIASTEQTLNTELRNLQILIVNVDTSNNKIVDTFRVDATENNIAVVKRFCAGNLNDDDRFDEYESGATQAALEEMLSMCDMVIRD